VDRELQAVRAGHPTFGEAGSIAVFNRCHVDNRAVHYKKRQPEASMRANDLYIFLEAEFGRAFMPEKRNDGRAYYWRAIEKAPRSTRLVRITETATGDVAEIKLAQSSIAEGSNVLLPLPASHNEVAAAVHTELSRLVDN
jgi:hypothetical protein